MSIYQVETDASIVEAKNTDAVLANKTTDNILQGIGARILDNYNSDLKLATFGELPYGPIYFSLIENEAPTDLMPIEGETVGG